MNFSKRHIKWLRKQNLWRLPFKSTSGNFEIKAKKVEILGGVIKRAETGAYVCFYRIKALNRSAYKRKHARRGVSMHPRALIPEAKVALKILEIL